MFEVEADVESNSALDVDDPAAGVTKDTAGTGSILQSSSVYPSALPLATGVEAPRDDGREEALETEDEGLFSVPTLTAHSVYSSLVSSSQALSAPTPTLHTITNSSAIFPNRVVLL